MLNLNRLKTLTASTFIASTLLMSNVYATKDAGHGHDYRTFHTNGKIEYGQIGDSYTSDLVMYLAGNQFMAMESVIKDFQSKNPDIKTVYVETIPPGQILKGQILKQGKINGKKTSKTPDLFASVNLGHLKKLKKKGIMNDYMIYTHNKLELMVAKGNPKNITGPKDMMRPDIVNSLPNPLTEGIFKFYGSQMLKDLGIYHQVTNDKKCKACWAIKDKTWFTERHHRETPYRIEQGQADTGIVWTTEVMHAKAENRAIDGVSIPAPYNMAHKVGYAIGTLKSAKNPYNAYRFLSYLGTSDAQEIYSKFGFVKASTEDLKLKPLAIH